jgi:PAS domain S-box-containing protein
MTKPARRSTDNPNSALMEVNALLRMVIDENPNVILMKDWDGKFLLANRALAELYGTRTENLVGKDDGAFNSSAEQVAFYLQNVRAVMVGGRTQVVMEQSTDVVTGETRHYQSIKIPLTTPEGAKQILVIANDVSELKRTQQKLEESERRLRYVLDSNGEGIWDWDIGTDVVTHNRRWCQIVGLNEDYLNHPLQVFAGLVHAEDKDRVMGKLQACLDGGSRYQSEHRMCLNDGRVIWVRDRGDVVERDADNKPVRMVGSFVDISEHKAAEMAAQQSDQLLREAVASIAQGFTIYDEQDRLYLCNEAYKRIYETSRDLIVTGSTFESIVRQGAQRGQYSAARDDIDAWVKQRLAQHQNANGQAIEQQLDDGRWLLIVESRTPSGYIVGNRIDITASKASEALVLEHSAQLNAIFALSPDGFVSFDERHCVKYVSPAFSRLTGLSEAHVLGVDESKFSHLLAALCTPELSFPGIAQLRLPLHTAHEVAQRQMIELAASANINRCVLAVEFRESQAHHVSQILYLRDVTHEAEVDRLKSEFLSTAAHELRTPMASIYGFAEVLLTQDVSNDDRNEFLGIIFKQSALMASILNELLDLARIEARRGKDFVMERVTARDLVDEVVSSFRLPPGRTAPIIETPDQPLMFVADRKKALQVVLNVLSNAYKYSMPPGSVRISITPQLGQVALRISDCGIGMTPSQISKVCERFYRADASGKVPGTGLGMSIVKEIMTLHHGSIEIESEPGQGTIVKLLFPISQPVSQAIV